MKGVLILSFYQNLNSNLKIEIFYISMKSNTITKEYPPLKCKNHTTFQTIELWLVSHSKVDWFFIDTMKETDFLKVVTSLD